MRLRILGVLGGAFLGMVLYLMFWPAKIDPIAFDAPADPEPYGPDTRLAQVERIGLDGRTGPEDVALGPDGALYAAVFEGEVLRLAPGATTWEPFVRTDGRPLGVVFDAQGRLLIADPYRGLLRVDDSGDLETLIPARHLAPQDVESLCYANNVDVAADGTIYVTDSSARFCPPDHGGTFEASLLDIMEHRATGRLVALNPKDHSVDVVMEELQFANGTAVSHDERYVLVVETGACRIWRYDRQQGTRQIIEDGMPGYPDNLTRGAQGRFWVGFTKPRSPFLDATAGWPWVRRVVARLPRALYPVPPSFTHVVAIDVEGVVHERHQDPEGTYPEATGVTETPRGLFIHSLTASVLARLPLERRAEP